MKSRSFCNLDAMGEESLKEDGCEQPLYLKFNLNRKMEANHCAFKLMGSNAGRTIFLIMGVNFS